MRLHRATLSLSKGRAACLALIAIGLLLAGPAHAQTSQIRDFDGATAWINSNPLRASDLRGKVVLVDFWEYSCINCLRTLPYLQSWYARYHKDGFVIVGVHTNEFAQTGIYTNVAAAVKRLDIRWPVAVDTNHAIWNRYNNDAWPRELLYDQTGRLIEDQEGEGAYQEIETNIQHALASAKVRSRSAALHSNQVK